MRTRRGGGAVAAVALACAALAPGPARGAGDASAASTPTAASSPSGSPPAAKMPDWPEGVRMPPRGWPDPPRWRVRLAFAIGSGGTLDEKNAVVAAFPVWAELGVRLWKLLSLTAQVTGVLETAGEAACDGGPAHGYAGAVGLRVDAWNGRSSGWAVPFAEAHVGVGGQPGRCGGAGAFVTGGARAGVDAWLGRTAVTVALAYEHLPAKAPLALSLGLTILVY